jgi:hypothetical protein
MQKKAAFHNAAFQNEIICIEFATNIPIKNGTKKSFQFFPILAKLERISRNWQLPLDTNEAIYHCRVAVVNVGH